MKSRTTERFRRQFQRLPKPVKGQARQAYRLFQENHKHPSLRFKKVHGTQLIYSARITLGYRAVGVIQGDEIIWYWIGSHAAYDKLLTQGAG